MLFSLINLFKKETFLFTALLFLLTSIQLCYSQDPNRYLLYGKVTDSIGSNPLPGASIYDKGYKFSAVVDSAGAFKINILPGEYEIICSYLGYRRVSKVVTVDSDIQLNFSLKQEIIKVNVVTVNANSLDNHVKSIQSGMIELSQNDIGNLPGLLGESDFYKTFQLLPGVQNSGEGDASMYVRGGGPDQNLILLDGATVYNPTHLFGFYSIFNTDAIANVRMYKSGMPAEYGNRVSSVVDFNTKHTVPDSLNISANIGLISSRLHIEIPLFNKRGMIYIAARKTYINTLLDASRRVGLIPNSSILHNSSYDFYDINAGFVFNLSHRDRLDISTYQGRDKFALASAAIEMHTAMDWGNRTVSLGWNHIFSDNFYLENRATYSGYNFNMGLTQNQYIFKLNSGINDLGYKARFSLNLPTHRIRGGWELLHHNISPNTSSALSDSTSLNLGSTDVYNSYELSTFISDEMKLSDRLSLNIGLRYNSFFQVGPFTNYNKNETGEIIDTVYYQTGKIVAKYTGLEPRISVRYLVSKNASIKFSYNRNNQYVNLINSASIAFPTDFWVSSSKYIKPQQGNQWAVGYFESILNFDASIEMYYKTSNNLIEFKKGIFSSIYNIPIEENLIIGKGHAYGLELLLRKSIGKLNGWVGYTISNTEKSFAEIENGRWFPAKYDRRHDLTAVLNYDLNNRWSFSSVFVFASGNAYTPIVGRYFIANNVINQYGKYNSARFPSYNRLDISATYTFKTVGKINSKLIFSIYNVYNRHNVFFVYPQATGNIEKFTLNIEAKEVYIFPILPSISWQLLF